VAPNVRRLENKEMCEKVIRLFNKKTLAGSKEPLLVKFADYGNKRKTPQYRARDPAGVWDRHDVSWGGHFFIRGGMAWLKSLKP
jgi:hypothetical protein